MKRDGTWTSDWVVARMKSAVNVRLEGEWMGIADTSSDIVGYCSMERNRHRRREDGDKSKMP